MSLLAGFTDLDVFVIEVTDFADGSSAFDADLSHFAGRESYLCIIAFLRHELRAVSCGSYQLGASARLKLDVVDHSTYRNVFQRKSVSYFDIRISTGNDDISDAELIRCDDVSLFTVRIDDECDVCASVRIVFDSGNLTWNSVFSSLEIYDSVLRSVAAASVSYGDLSSDISAGVLLESNGE